MSGICFPHLDILPVTRNVPPYLLGLVRSRSMAFQLLWTVTVAAYVHVFAPLCRQHPSGMRITYEDSPALRHLPFLVTIDHLPGL